MAVVGAAGATLTACASPEDDGKEDLKSGVILHSVYFWLKTDLTEDERADFLNFFKALNSIPNVRFLTYGAPAPTNPRPVVENSFDYNLIVTFDKMENLNVYETHPTHLKAIEDYSKYWTKVMVHDTLIA
ncbi:Dabb family protein [Sphingobacterium hungaricum]